MSKVKILLAFLALWSVACAVSYVSTRSLSNPNKAILSSLTSIGAIGYASTDIQTYPLTSAVVSVTLFIPTLFTAGTKSFSYTAGTSSFTQFKIAIVVEETGSGTTILTPNPFLLVPTATFLAGGTAPGIIVMSFDDNALIPITSVRYPYTGTFNVLGANSGAITTLNQFIGQFHSVGAFTKIPYFSVIEASAQFGSPRILAAAVTINCAAAKTYTLYATTSKPGSSIDANGIYFASAYGSQVTLENVVQRGTGINARLSGLTVDFNAIRYQGAGHVCADSTTVAFNNYIDASVILQFFPEVGPMFSIVLDSGTSSQWQTTSSWQSPTTIASTISAGSSYTYYLPIGDLNWMTPTAVGGTQEAYRTAAQTVSSLLGASPYGTWRLVVVDAVGTDNTYWCVVSAHLNLETCDPCTTTPCATTPCC